MAPNDQTAANPGFFPQFTAENESWSLWHTRLENHLTYHQVSDPTRKRCALLAYMGAEAFRKLHDKVHPDREVNELTYDEITATLKSVYEPSLNMWSSRSKFRDLRQNPSESLLEFEGRLRKASTECKWEKSVLQDNLIEQFLRGIADTRARQFLLMKTEKLTKLCEVFDAADNYFRVQRAASSTEIPTTGVNKIFNNKKKRNRSTKPRGSPQQHSNQSQQQQQHSSKEKACFRCGDRNHLAPACQHKSTTCKGCGKVGHLRQVCRSAPQPQNFLQEIPFHYVTSKEPLCVTVSVNGHDVNMEVDTGSGISTMTLNAFRSIAPSCQLRENDVCLRTATGESFQPHSYADVKVTYKNQKETLRLYLINKQSFPTLIGRDWLRKISLDWSTLLHSQTVQSCKQIVSSSTLDYKAQAKKLLLSYKNLSKPGIGCIPSAEAKLELTVEKPTPFYARARPVAHSIIGMTDTELEFLEDNGVIQRINVSDWAHPIVVVPRAQGRKVRICGDFKPGINRFIRIDEHPLKNIRYALDNIGNGTKFSKLDIFSAFLHMPVRESDRKFLVVNTHRGLYQFNRMSNGLSNAPAIWQRFIEGVLAGIDGVECVMDDIIITAPTDDEHLRRLDTVFSRLDQHDIRLNPEKCEFFEESVTYCGFRLKHQEIHKCDDKVEAIRRAPAPKNVGELRSFLGMIQFYASFAARLADLASPLYALLKSTVKYTWSDRMEEAFTRIKQELCSPTVLVPFDPQKPIVLATDASPYGISAVLSHRFPDNSERPIAFYSRVLTETEQRYSQIDKEALGIKNGVERFFYYIFGRRFTLITDSRPLSQIFAPERTLPALSATRMQHYAVYLTGFSFDIVYRPTKLHGNADALSRLPIKSEQLSPVDPSNQLVINQLHEVPLQFETIAEETKKDKELKPLWEILQGSVDYPRKSKFFGVDVCEFSMFDGKILLRGHRVVVPEACRNEILKELHEGHYGSEKMKNLARRYVWWYGIDSDIKNITLSCQACLAHARSPPKEIIHSWEPTNVPMERIHMDYAGPVDGKYILLIVDSFSRWLEAFVTSNKTSLTTLVHLRETVARYGIPRVIVTDNDPTFVSAQFEHFCSVNGVKHLKSPPFHPSSNGQCERYVGTLKLALKKMSSEGGDLQQNLSLFLFRQRMMTSASGSSPALRMLGRELRTKLDLLKERPPRKTFNCPPKFSVGEAVMTRDYRSSKPKWIPGRISRVCGTRICEVKVPIGTWKRHFEQIRKRNELEQPHREEEDDSAMPFIIATNSEESEVHELSEDEFYDLGSDTSDTDAREDESYGNRSSLQPLVHTEDPDVSGTATAAATNSTVNSVPISTCDTTNTANTACDTVNSNTNKMTTDVPRKSSRSTKGIPPNRFGH